MSTGMTGSEAEWRAGWSRCRLGPGASILLVVTVGAGGQWAGMIAEMLFGVTPVHAEFIRRAEDFRGWLGSEGLLWAYYENKFWGLSWIRSDPVYGEVYAVEWAGRTLTVSTVITYTDPAGMEASGYWALDSATGAATYAWGVHWGFLHRIGENEYCWG